MLLKYSVNVIFSHHTSALAKDLSITPQSDVVPLIHHHIQSSNSCKQTQFQILMMAAVNLSCILETLYVDVRYIRRNVRRVTLCARTSFFLLLTSRITMPLATVEVTELWTGCGRNQE
jgi:hypothetical protein